MDNFEFQEQKLITVLGELRSIFYDYDFHSIHEGSRVQQLGDEEKMYFSRELDQYEEAFKNQARVAYLTIQAYLELKALPKYLEMAVITLEPFFKTSSKLMESGYHEESGDNYNLFTYECFTILSPFGFLSHLQHEAMLRRTGIIYLENILENTAVIINDLGESPKSEAQVYNAVKTVLKSTFPSSKDSSSTAFQQTAKCYKPDILLPSLNCAIEYKYATTKQDLINTVDQILMTLTDMVKIRITNYFTLFFMQKRASGALRSLTKCGRIKIFPVTGKAYWCISPQRL